MASVNTDFGSISLQNEDLYALLGVKRNAAPKTIKEVYMKEAKRLHSDKTRNNKLSIEQLKENEVRLKILTEAYKILNNPLKRRQYDMQYAADLSELRSDFTNELEQQRLAAELERTQKPQTMDELIRQRDAHLREIGGFESSGYHFSSQRMSNDKFNALFEENRTIDPSYHGYGQDLAERTTSTDYNPNVDIGIGGAGGLGSRTFMTRRGGFNRDKFNNMFDHFSMQDPDKQVTRVTDDSNVPEGMGSSGNFSNISSFNGLMFVGDENYTTSSFSDYNYVFNEGGSMLIDPTKNDYNESALSSVDINRRLNELRSQRSMTIEPNQRNRGLAERELIESQTRQIEIENERKKEYAQRFIGAYPKMLQEQALGGYLDSSHTRPEQDM